MRGISIRICTPARKSSRLAPTFTSSSVSSIGSGPRCIDCALRRLPGDLARVAVAVSVLGDRRGGRRQEVVGHELLSVAIHVHAELLADRADPGERLARQLRVGDYQVLHVLLAHDAGQGVERAEHGQAPELAALHARAELDETDRLDAAETVAAQAAERMARIGRRTADE